MYDFRLGFWIRQIAVLPHSLGLYCLICLPELVGQIILCFKMSNTNTARIDSFDPKKIKLEVWLSMLQAHFAFNNITEATKKKNSLLVSLGSDAYSTLASLSSPDLPHEKNYDELVLLLESHYKITPSYHRSLILFQQRKKKAGESLRDLYADLKTLAKNCSFGTNFDARVRDQLFMAVDTEVYFPNLVAENFKLQDLSSTQTLERILNLEKAFIGEKLPSEIQALGLGPNPSSHNSQRTNFCRHCGYPHRSEDCRFSHLTCSICNTKGHLKKVCRFKRNNQGSDVRSRNSSGPSQKFSSGKERKKRESGKKKANAVFEEDSEDESDDNQLLRLEDRPIGDSHPRPSVPAVDTLDSSVPDVHSPEIIIPAGDSYLHSVVEGIFTIRTKINLEVNGKKVTYEVDSGASVSTITDHWVDKLKLSMKPSDKVLKAYGDHDLEVLGKAFVNVLYNGHSTMQCFYVVDSNNPNLCGRDLMPKIGIFLAGLEEDDNIVNNVFDAKVQLENFSVDPTLPISSMVAKVHLKRDAVPSWQKARPVPFHYRKLVEDALDKLVADDIIESVNSSTWAAPIVPVLKPDRKSMRICVDFKMLNKNIACDKYPLPKVDEILAVVGKSKIFSKIDLKDAYLQVPVDDESQNLLVVNTHKGLFKYKRLPFGLASSPAIFQRFMSQLLKDIDGVVAFLDDILIGGETKEEHDTRLNLVLKVFQKHNVAINKKKTVLNTSSIEYLGYVISGDGIKPSPKKLTAILEAPTPKSVGEVQSFLGMVTYYCRFVRNFSSVLAPLYDLLKKGSTFKWSSVEAKAFCNVKEELAKSDLLANFDSEHLVIVEVDASPVGVGCVLMQEMNGYERPIYFASKKLSAAESNYSQLDKEALALIYAVTKFKYFLLGRKFVIRTDHKPLLGLFGRDKQIPMNANARVQRWALLLSQYDYDLRFKAGKDNVVADALSRLPVSDSVLDSSTPAEYISLVECLENQNISYEKVRLVTKNDPILSKVIQCVKFGWGSDALLSEYAAVKSDLSIYDNVLLFRNRVVIPADLRSNILAQLHVGHNGISAMKAEARNWIWWPKLDQDISEVTKACSICFKNLQNPRAVTLSWPETGKPWCRLHVDYAGPIGEHYFLVIVDSNTKFMDVHVTKSTSSAVTINMLRRTFSNFGLPDILVTDNASYFVSEEMEFFLNKNGIKHMTPAPYNPSSNGLAERGVKTLKEGLSKFEKGDINTRICRFLYNHRRTIHSSTGKAPAELMFSRNFRGLVENIKPKGKKERVLEKGCSFEKANYKVDDAVFVKNYGKGKTWLEGKIIDVLGVRNFKVQLKDFGNMIWKRHADQLMPRYLPNVPNECVFPKNDLCDGQSIVPNFPFINVDSQSCAEVRSNPGIIEDVSGSEDNIVVTTGEPEPHPVRRSSRVSKPPDRLDL